MRLVIKMKQTCWHWHNCIFSIWPLSANKTENRQVWQQKLKYNSNKENQQKQQLRDIDMAAWVGGLFVEGNVSQAMVRGFDLCQLFHTISVSLRSMETEKKPQGPCRVPCRDFCQKLHQSTWRRRFVFLHLAGYWWSWDDDANQYIQ